jgi:hypothetical protein
MNNSQKKGSPAFKLAQVALAQRKQNLEAQTAAPAPKGARKTMGWCRVDPGSASKNDGFVCYISTKEV